MVNTNKEHHKVTVKVKINAAPEEKKSKFLHTLFTSAFIDLICLSQDVLTWLLHIDISVKLEAECKY